MLRAPNWIALILYALATTLAPGLHDHGKAGCVPAAAADCEDQGPGLVHQPEAASAGANHACAACSVQAEHAADLSPPSLSGVAHVVDASASADPPIRPAPRRLLLPSRAPPRA